MIIVAGKLTIAEGRRAEFLAASRAAIAQARATPGCIDFNVAADLLEENRVNVYEAWESKAELDAFRGEGPNDSMSELIESADVYQKVVNPND